MTSSQAQNHQLAELYEQDFCQWADAIAQRLREGRFDALDVEHLIEEIEDMSWSQKRVLLRNLRIVLLHLLKYRYQPEQRSQSWRSSIIEHRIRMTELFEDSPSLRAYLLESFEKSYQKARKQATVETELPLKTFPDISPFSVEDVLNEDWLPD